MAGFSLLRNLKDQGQNLLIANKYKKPLLSIEIFHTNFKFQVKKIFVWSNGNITVIGDCYA